MKQQFLKTILPIVLLVAAVFIIGSSCGEPEPDSQSWYLDNDGDGFGTREDVNWHAPPQPPGYADNPNDCDDTNALINPNGTEIPGNNIDENCNGLIAYTFYKDRDDDGFGDPNSATVIEIVLGGEAPDGVVFISGDCNDENDLINPIADEKFGNNIDDNCNGEVDTDDNYIDDDGDGYGSTEVSAANGVNNNIDCDDNNADVHPYTIEVQNGLDDDCDGVIDETN
jgi:hypothetical protein